MTSEETIRAIIDASLGASGEPIWETMLSTQDIFALRDVLARLKAAEARLRHVLIETHAMSEIPLPDDNDGTYGEWLAAIDAAMGQGERDA